VIRTLAASAVALALAAPSGAPVWAQSNAAPPDADILGAWSFQTEPYENLRCQMTGELILTETSVPNVYGGELIAYEACDGAQIYEARQSATVTRDGDRLTITSTLLKVLPRPDAYAPDNFELEIVSSALMVGELRSADIAPATFRRREVLVS
jgi:hypothetical protein